MPELTVHYGTDTRVIEYEGTPLLSEVLSATDLYVAQPCGGRGRCGKCRVEAVGELSPLSEEEKRVSSHLVCRTRLLGNAEVWLSVQDKSFNIEEQSAKGIECGTAMTGKLGSAIDIGTTTLVLHLYELSRGQLVGRASSPNPQRAVAADVIGRIRAALDGKQQFLKKQISGAISELLNEACRNAGVPAEEVSSFVVTGNTTMMYLLTGTCPSCLSHAPFIMDESFGGYYELLGRRAYLPRCMHAFVGADVTCAILASSLCSEYGTALLCDIGTNGEMALWKNGRLYITSTAAGPAFEGAGISCGCGSVAGAIDKVKVENGAIVIHTVGGAKPVGLCGSGLIDAAAAFLELGDIDKTGACEEDELPLCENLSLLPKDIRALQLAKAAIAAGIETLLKVSKTDYDEIERFMIAGGFGSHLDIHSAVRIGLFPAELSEKARPIGNAALAGASMLMLKTELISEAEKTASMAEYINLGSNPEFNECYIDSMMFPV